MMQQEFKMNSEKKVYRKPLMEVIHMDRQSDLLCESGCDDVLKSTWQDPE
jgi:hypothetical protein